MDREPGMLQSMGSQRVGHDLAPELNRCYDRTRVFLGIECPNQTIYSLIYVKLGPISPHFHKSLN